MKIEIKAKNFEQALIIAPEKTGKSLDELDIVCIQEPGFLRKGVYSVSYEDVKENKKETKEKTVKAQVKKEDNNKNNAKVNKPETKKEIKKETVEVKKTEQKSEHNNIKQPKQIPENKNNNIAKINVENEPKIEIEENKEESAEQNQEENKEYKVNPAELDYFVRNFIVEFAKQQGVEVEVEGLIRDGNKIYVLTGDNAHKLIGYHGENLNAMQIIIGAVVSEKFSISTRILLDIEQYKEKREESLKALARRTARKVIQTRKSQKLEPMNANERRIIHSELQSNQKVTTESHGIEPHRFVVIKLK